MTTKSISLIALTFSLIPHSKYSKEDFSLEDGDGDFFICREIPEIFFPEIAGADNMVLKISNKRFKSSKKITILKEGSDGVIYQTNKSQRFFIYPQLEEKLKQFFSKDEKRGDEVNVYFNCRVGNK